MRAHLPVCGGCSGDSRPGIRFHSRPGGLALTALRGRGRRWAEQALAPVFPWLLYGANSDHLNECVSLGGSAGREGSGCRLPRIPAQGARHHHPARGGSVRASGLGTDPRSPPSPADKCTTLFTESPGRGRGRQGEQWAEVPAEDRPPRVPHPGRPAALLKGPSTHSRLRAAEGSGRCPDTHQVGRGCSRDDQTHTCPRHTGAVGVPRPAVRRETGPGVPTDIPVLPLDVCGWGRGPSAKPDAPRRGSTVGTCSCLCARGLAIWGKCA